MPPLEERVGHGRTGPNGKGGPFLGPEDSNETTLNPSAFLTESTTLSVNTISP